ncbi:NAD(P)-dependent alcohol dehydrogenase [Helicobacter sp. MIT 05-5293]|uniref:NAD(P)-dependent alcohol dehydrogenase n=1 Tax=Helicobacter sp. MIT 05-5293 TaxID=1548149 RepID=UPI0010FECDE7|nr:NAD(P)-dependent alcohol dehydrogenase [Helicobacter sp. MIT 05-5293]TLD80922.1 NAD(P)-dependent alcohol dehydrogenase [Helicobacter sp. MIT 05-5293]
MQNEHNKTRREFLLTSAKIAGGAAALGFGANLFAQNASNANAANTATSTPFGLQEALKGEEIPSVGYAAHSKDWKFKPFQFTRHPLGANDVLLQILYAGICHSDLHSVSGDHHPPTYPIVPGHEILGKVVAVGKNVSKFKVGDYAGVGCMVNSCGECEACKASKEQYCTNSKTIYTYNSKDVFHGGANTYGGYSNNIVLSEKFAIKVPKNAELEKVAPLLCAGITTYSPIMFSRVKKGDKVAVAGLGGLGHMALQYMAKLGAEVTCFDIVDKKDACLALGAKEFVNVKSPRFSEFANTFDFIISTIPYHYDVNAYHKMLKFGGEMAIVGLPASKDKPKLDFDAFVWNFQNKKLYPSVIGGIKETQEMLDFSVKNRIYPKVQIIPINQLDEAYKVVAAGKADFRFVIDMSSLKV